MPFQVCDVYRADPQEVALEVSGDLLISGTVTDESDSVDASHLVVVSVERCQTPVVVRGERLVVWKMTEIQS